MTRILPFSLKKQEESENTSTKKRTDRRTYDDIRSAITKCLREFPSSTYSIARRAKLDIRVAYRHLEHFRQLGSVEKVVMKYGRRKACYWRLR